MQPVPGDERLFSIAGPVTLVKLSNDREYGALITEPQPRLLPVTRFSTEGLAPARALDGWRAYTDVFIESKPTDRDGFRGRMDIYLLESLLLGRFDCATQVWDRSRHRIARDGLAHYGLQIYLRGTCGARGGGPAAVAGDLFVCDLAQPHVTETRDPDCLFLMIPRPLLEPLLKTPDGHASQRLPGHLPLVALFRQHLLSLYAHAQTMSCADAEALSRPTLHLAAAALNAAVQFETVGAVSASLGQAIRQYVSVSLGDPDLSAASVAARFGISVRSLYYLLEAQGGFASFVQAERLRLARRMLSDPAEAHRSIAEIAEAAGFTHRSTFVRAFRRMFDLSPREIRVLSFEERVQRANDVAPADWRRWMNGVA